jgi:hypothetical protein
MKPFKLSLLLTILEQSSSIFCQGTEWWHIYLSNPLGNASLEKLVFELDH